MNTTKQAQQLRLAADIIETGHPWEIDDNAGGGFRKPLFGENPGKAAFINGKIRIVLAAPPDGRPLHNPDNLTAEQVGAGWRFILKGEKPTPGAQIWMGEDDINGAWEKRDVEADPYYAGNTYRVPLSVPWPEVEKPDLYAELKAAHAAGKVIQVWDDGNIWRDISNPSWCLQVNEYRIKPEPLPPPPVPLGPEDVPPGTVLRGAGEAKNYDGGWCIITSCSRTGIRIWRECDSNPTEITWRTIKDAKSEINRSIPLTGKWDPTAWEPCSKEVPA